MLALSPGVELSVRGDAGRVSVSGGDARHSLAREKAADQSRVLLCHGVAVAELTVVTCRGTGGTVKGRAEKANKPSELNCARDRALNIQYKQK